MNGKKLILMFTLSLVVMFFTMYAMIWVWGHFYLNINKVYMALLMVGAMGLVNLVTMYGMYKSRNTKYWVLAISLVVVLGSFILIRNQTGVGNRQFLKAMIPHHSSAILMCEKADLTDQAINELCDDIVATQEREIKIMQELLEK